VLVVGLTGGIASGKSTVSALLKERCYMVLDADEFARDVAKPHTAGWQEIWEVFGEEYFHPDGSLDRSRLAETIFRDATARHRLNEIIHPKVLALIESRIQESRNRGESLVIVDVPLLFEVGWDKQVDKVVVVYVKPEIQLARLLERDNLTLEEAQNRIAAQLPLSLKAQQADYVIDNSGSLEDTSRQVDMIMDTLLRGYRQ
jgi:dephospho-CoA kinase